MEYPTYIKLINHSLTTLENINNFIFITYYKNNNSNKLNSRRCEVSPKVTTIIERSAATRGKGTNPKYSERDEI